MLTLRRRTVQTQEQNLQVLANALRWLDAALTQALMGREVEGFAEHDSKGLVEGMGLEAKRTGNLALLDHQRQVKPGMKAREVVCLQAEQLATLAAEVMWYDNAVRLAIAGQPVREASHHDAAELLEAMGIKETA